MILHVDLDAFFASVEQLADPKIAGRPVVVGGLGPRGVVAAASYEAREFGIFSAMPMAVARRRCPDAIFLAPRLDAYGDASRAVMAIMGQFTPLVEPISLDEAYLDVSGSTRLLGAPLAIGAELRERIKAETGLVASVGGGSTKSVAKIASGAAKPNGMLIINPQDERAFLDPLDISVLWGVGAKAKAQLNQVGVQTIADLAALSESTLIAMFGNAQGQSLLSMARNDDQRFVEPERRARSIGHEKTFDTDLADVAELKIEILKLSAMVAARLRSAGVLAKAVTLKARDGDFVTISRTRTPNLSTDTTAEVTAIAVALFEEMDVPSGGLRLIGVSAQLANGEIEGEQLTLLPGDLQGSTRPTSGRELSRALDQAGDEVRRRFGPNALGTARGVRGRGPLD